ncbi:MAG: putative toxin-antitoxin system toxin component, PIN family [Burkholderiales bacterium]|nr:MAG: putative toxin-antitoxin system toxin component, PIN family [Burkholderiales bacterium]
MLDTNVWLQWLVFEDPRLEALNRYACEGAIRLVGHTRCRAELARVLERDAIAARSPTATQQLLARYDRLVENWTDALMPAPLHCRDREDQVFLDLAFAAGARWLVTRDKALLALAARARRLPETAWPLRPKIVTPEALQA